MLVGKQYTAIDFARMAWCRRWFVIVPLAAGMYGTLLLSSRMPDVYQSEMLIQVMPQQVSDAFVQPTRVTLRTEDRLNALRQQALRRTELEQLIATFDLYPARASSPMQVVVETMRQNVDFEIASSDVGGRSPISRRSERAPEAFYVRFTYPDAEMAKRVTERLGALFVEQNARDRGASADQTSEFIESQLAEDKGHLEELDRALQLFREQHAGRLPGQLDFNMRALDRVQTQLQAYRESIARDQDRRLMLERLYNEAQTGEVEVSAPRGPLSGQLSDADLAEAETPQERLALARSALAGMELRLQPEHPDILRTKRIIEELELEIATGSAERLDTVLSRDQMARRDRLQEMRAEVESLGRQIGV